MLELQNGVDHTLEADLVGMTTAMNLRKSDAELGLSFSSNEDDLKDYNTYIVTVPTPINKFNMPDL